MPPWRFFGRTLLELAAGLGAMKKFCTSRRRDQAISRCLDDASLGKKDTIRQLSGVQGMDSRDAAQPPGALLPIHPIRKMLQPQIDSRPEKRLAPYRLPTRRDVIFHEMNRRSGMDACLLRFHFVDDSRLLAIVIEPLRSPDFHTEIGAGIASQPRRLLQENGLAAGTRCLKRRAAASNASAHYKHIAAHGRPFG